MSYVIKVENLGKKYNIRHQQPERYVALRDVVANRVQRVGSSVLGFSRHILGLNGTANGKSSYTEHPKPNTQNPIPNTPTLTTEEFWALKDINFEVKQGEVLGIIGRNGAGKSTLLKILSQITEPTVGRVRIRGRVASLLEVGTGFHPELTGRENIFVNGAILGMTRAEIQKKFDEIVAFAEIEKFLDTPFKRYSSGMYVRLAFAIAAHLDPDILLVDEVLAVGDTEFQRKCLGKLQDESRSECRTVLFVSHNMGMIQSICSTGIYLEAGTVKFHGNGKEAVLRYCANVKNCSDITFKPRRDKPTITRISIDDKSLNDGDLILDIDFQSPFPLSPPIPGVVIASNIGIPVFGSNPRFHNDGFNGRSSSVGRIRMAAQKLPLLSGNYSLSVWLGDWQRNYDAKLDVMNFEFRSKNTSSLIPDPEIIGHIDWATKWKVM